MPGCRVTPPLDPIRTLQIIVAAIVVGCIFFLGIALTVRGVPDASASLTATSYSAFATATILVLARLVVPGIIVARGRHRARQDTPQPPATPLDGAMQTEDDVLAGLFMTRTIVAAAILEGAIFLLLVVYLVEPSRPSLLLAVILLVALAAHFPRESRFASWLGEQSRLLDDERSF